MIDPSAKIHPSAVIAQGAHIGPACEIGPFCVIGPKVCLDQGVICYAHIVIEGDTHIGAGTRIWPFASIGHQPQDLKYAGEETTLRIGRNNMIRESTSINRGTLQGGGITVIGDDNLFMLGAHVGHDCMIGNGCVFANNVALAGHVEVEDGVVIGGQSGVVQFSRIGRYAMIGAGVIVDRDVLPFSLVQAARPHLGGVNIVGLKRQGLDHRSIQKLSKFIKDLFKGPFGLRENVQRLNESEFDSYERHIADFVNKSSKRSYLGFDHVD